MSLRRLLVLVGTAVLVPWSAATFAAQAETAPKVAVLVTTDRPEAVYKCGETATFRVSVTAEGKPVTAGKANVRLTLDSGKQFAARAVDLGPQPITVSQALAEPGFVQCQVTFADNGQKYMGLAGAGFDPERIRTRAVMPADFDTFWAAGRAELAKIPPDVQVTPVPEKSTAHYDCFAISFANVGNTRMHGFLSVPKGKPGPFPGYLEIPGAGVGGPRGPPAIDGVLCLTVTVHTYRLDLPAEEYARLAKNELSGYQRSGAPDREQYFFRRVILGLDRALEYLAGRPDFDGKHLCVYGSSQGGGLSLIMAGFNPRVTAVAANVPALCDHAGYLAERRPGWPQLASGAPEAQRAAFLAMSAYFDAALFARRIKCPAIVSVGFIDTTCSPSSVYSAFNEIQTPKRMYHCVTRGHSFLPEFVKFQQAWRAGQLGVGPVLEPTAAK